MTTARTIRIARNTARVSLMPPVPPGALTGAILRRAAEGRSVVEAVAEAAPELVGDRVVPVVVRLRADVVDRGAQIAARVVDLGLVAGGLEALERFLGVLDRVLLRIALVADLVARVLADVLHGGLHRGQRAGGLLRGVGVVERAHRLAELLAVGARLVLGRLAAGHHAERQRREERERDSAGDHGVSPFAMRRIAIAMPISMIPWSTRPRATIHTRVIRPIPGWARMIAPATRPSTPQPMFQARCSRTANPWPSWSRPMTTHQKPSA